MSKERQNSSDRTDSRFKQKLTEQKAVVEKINEWVERNGYAKCMHAFCDHKSGLPKIPNCLVRPTFCNHSGSRTVMITPTDLFVADINKPYHENTWKITEKVSYETESELKVRLDPLVFSDLGIWADSENR